MPIATSQLPEITEKFKVRFWSKVEKKDDSECWIWKGVPDNGGYGNLWVKRRPILAHRISYFLAHGELLKELCVLHDCDTPLCVNPSHLHLGTKGENNAERKARGRGAVGSMVRGGSPGGRLTDEKVIQIRAEFEIYQASLSEHRKCVLLGEKYGVTPASIYCVIRGLSWKHIPMPTLRVRNFRQLELRLA